MNTSLLCSKYMQHAFTIQDKKFFFLTCGTYNYFVEFNEIDMRLNFSTSPLLEIYKYQVKLQYMYPLLPSCRFRCCIIVS